MAAHPRPWCQPTCASARVPQSHGALRGAQRGRHGHDRPRLEAAPAGDRHRLPPPRGAAAVRRGRTEGRGRGRALDPDFVLEQVAKAPSEFTLHAPQPRAQLPGRRRRDGLHPGAGAAVRARGRRAARCDVRRLLPLHQARPGLRRLRHGRRPAVRAERPAARLAPPRHAARAADADRQALQRRAGLARPARSTRSRWPAWRSAAPRRWRASRCSTPSSTSTRRCSTTGACSTRSWPTPPPASR